ncbi:hypothetical protein EDD15DRAFT_2199579 [Pisolithus albus]|nr:hypothetical protein EDD15DRAFT_2199579 [Pisolithus albus]
MAACTKILYDTYLTTRTMKIYFLCQRQCLRSSVLTGTQFGRWTGQYSCDCGDRTPRGKMKLLDVEVVLDRDKGIQQAKHKAEVMKEHDDTTTRYAILSHRWGAEVDYDEMIGLMKMEEEEREDVKQRHGYQKIIESCKQAMKDGYKWLWVDTCCIDKRSSAELSEAINSMYRWYQNAQMCYAYLNDVDEPIFPTEPDNSKFDKSNGWPEWFVRGWTLQELIAPKQVEFFNKDWVPIGNKRQLAPTLEYITGIPRGVLTSGLTGKRLSVAQIMSWAAERRTTRVEDRAYSLMGLFGVNMPMLYGEGSKAFRRLQLEIIREFNDHSIFAWNPRRPRTGSVLAEDPSDFWDCGSVERLEPAKFADRLMVYIEDEGLRNTSRSGSEELAALLDTVDSQQFHIFTPSNAGIQVLLPVIPSRDSPSHFRAILPCTRDLDLVTVDLVSSGRSFARSSIDSLLPATYPEFKTLHLIHYQDTNEMRHESALDDKYASFHGFTRRCTYPREFTSNIVTHSSLVEDLIVVVYADNTGSSFAIGLGHYLGQGWVHVVDGGHSPTEEENWADIARQVYCRMWRARAKHARLLANYDNPFRDAYFIQHVHLPRSIRAVRVVWKIRRVDGFIVMVDVVECPGCCGGPCRMTTADVGTFSICSNACRVGMWGIMEEARHSYWLQLDDRRIWAEKCSGQQIELGDYGDYSNGNLVRTGNIFEGVWATGIDLEDSSRSMVSSSTSRHGIHRWIGEGGSIVAYNVTGRQHLVLHRPKIVSLPANERISLLLKSLSVRLAGKYLVTAVIRCSAFEKGRNLRRQNYSNADSAADSGDPSAEAGLLTPLCVIARPDVWKKEPLCEERRELFKSIRENFYALVDGVPCSIAPTDQPMGTEPSHNSPNIQKKVTATKFFSDLFGLNYLKNYIGDITFFTRFPSMIETGLGWDHALKSSCLHGMGGGKLLVKCFVCRFGILEKDEKRRAKSTPYRELWVLFGQPSCMLYDSRCRQLNTPSLVQDIRSLQVKLDETRDEDEQRALEEDITGKVWNHIAEETTFGCTDVISMAVDRSTDSGDDQVHLRRIMLDAGVNTSKYQLWFDARATEQAKWSDMDMSAPAIASRGGDNSNAKEQKNVSWGHLSIYKNITIHIATRLVCSDCQLFIHAYVVV